MKVMPVYGEMPWKIRMAGTVWIRRRRAAKKSHARVRQSISSRIRNLPGVMRMGLQGLPCNVGRPHLYKMMPIV